MLEWVTSVSNLTVFGHLRATLADPAFRPDPQNNRQNVGRGGASCK